MCVDQRITNNVLGCSCVQTERMLNDGHVVALLCDSKDQLAPKSNSLPLLRCGNGLPAGGDAIGY